MPLVITEGYLIGRYNYLEFDEILVFINKFGNKFTCIAKGTKKIQSKNARALQWGNFLQIELFHSSSTNKLSKLKKVTILNNLDFKKSCNLALITISDVLCSLKTTNLKCFNFYQEIIIKILNDYDEYKLSIYIFIYFIKHFLKTIKVINCIHNKNQKYYFDFITSSFICCECNIKNTPLTIDELLLIVNYYKNSNDTWEKFFSNKYNINWEEFYAKLRTSFNKYINKINEIYYKGINKNVKSKI